MNEKGEEIPTMKRDDYYKLTNKDNNEVIKVKIISRAGKAKV